VSEIFFSQAFPLCDGMDVNCTLLEEWITKRASSHMATSFLLVGCGTVLVVIGARVAKTAATTVVATAAGVALFLEWEGECLHRLVASGVGASLALTATFCLFHKGVVVAASISTGILAYVLLDPLPWIPDEPTLLGQDPVRVATGAVSLVGGGLAFWKRSLFLRALTSFAGVIMVLEGIARWGVVFPSVVTVFLVLILSSGGIALQLHLEERSSSRRPPPSRPDPPPPLPPEGGDRI